MTKIKVTQKENTPEIATEITAQAIEKISEAMQKLLAGRLKRDTLLALIKYNCPSWVGKREIEEVLISIETLDKKLLKGKNPL